MKDDPHPSSPSGKPQKNGQQSWFERLFSGNEPQNIEQLLDILRDAQARDMFDVHAMAMIEGVFEVSDLRVRDIMIPRSQMTVIDEVASFEEILATVTQSGHSRFPIVGEDKDQLLGVILAKDLLRFAGQPERFNIDEVMREVVIIPEGKRLNTLLNEFRSSRNHLAMVVDEYGGVSGLVTIEDVLEVIVGDIDDEHDAEDTANIRANQKGHFSVSALTEIDEFNEHFGVALSDDDADTIGGYILRHLGHMPKRGEKVELEGLMFTILGADSRRIYRLKVTPVASTQVDAE